MSIAENLLMGVNRFGHCLTSGMTDAVSFRVRSMPLL
jgi:hypothetical protein